MGVGVGVGLGVRVRVRAFGFGSWRGVGGGGTAEAGLSRRLTSSGAGVARAQQAHGFIGSCGRSAAARAGCIKNGSRGKSSSSSEYSSEPSDSSSRPRFEPHTLVGSLPI